MSIEKFLIHKKIVKNKKQANIVMIVIIMICLLFIIQLSKRKDNSQKMEPLQIDQPEIAY